MAIFRHSPLIGAISGSIGGVTFVHTSKSPVARHRPVKTRKHPSTEQISEWKMQNLVRTWNIMTPELRHLWNDTATRWASKNRLAQSRFLSGYQLFLKFQKYVGIPFPSGPGLPPELNSYEPQRITQMTANTPPSLVLTFTSPPFPFYPTIEIYFSTHWRPAPPAFPSAWRYSRQRAISFDTMNVLGDYLSVCAPLVLNQFIAIKVRFFGANLLPSAHQTFTTTVTA